VARPFLAVVAGGFLIGGLLLTFISDPGPDELAWGGILLRSGMLMGAWWLVMPSARNVRRSTWIGIALAALVLVVRPRLILWGLFAGAIVALGTRWDGRRSD